MLSKRFTRRESVLLGVLVALMLVAGYILVIHQPVTRSLDETVLRQEDADLQVAMLEVKAEKLQEMKAELEEIHAEADAVAMPTYDNLQKVMIFLNATLAGTTDYSLNFRPVQLPEEGNVVRRGIDMTFQCPSYGEAEVVLSALHASPYRAQLSALAMAPVAEGRENPDLRIGAVQVDLTVTFFEVQK